MAELLFHKTNFSAQTIEFHLIMARQKAFDKEEVLDKAMYLFWKKGYNGTSMQDLVDHLGISRSSMYDTFGGKYKLFMNALSRYQSRQSLQIDMALTSEEDLKDFLKGFFMGVVDECRQDEERKGCFTVNTSIELAPHDDRSGQLSGKTSMDSLRNSKNSLRRHRTAGSWILPKTPKNWL